MKKHYYLFLLFLLVTINSSFASTGYYMEFSDSYTPELLQQKFNTSWQGYAPQIESYENNIVYFQSEQDLIRALINPVYTATNLYIDNVKVFSNNKRLDYAIYRVSGSTIQVNKVLDYNYTSYAPCNGYIMGDAEGESFVDCGAYVKLDGTTVYGTSAGKVYGIKRVMFGDSGNLQLNLVSDCGYTAYAHTWVVAFGNVQIPEAQKLKAPLPKGQLTIFLDDEECSCTLNGETTTINNNTKITLPVGTYHINFSKVGYWGEERDITISEDESMTLHIDLFPRSSMFKIQQLDTISTYQNNDFVTRLSIKPVQEVTSVRLEFPTTEAISVSKNNEEIAINDDEIYDLGTIGTQGITLTVKLPAGALTGSKSNSIRVVGTDFSGQTYIATKLINYQVNELPVLVELPALSTGTNTFKITEKTGNPQRVSILLQDNTGKSIYSKDYDLGSYQSYNFNVDLEVKDYNLIISGEDYNAKYPLNIKNSITLDNNEFQVSKGGQLDIPLSLKNPYLITKYYTVKVMGASPNCLTNDTELTYSIAPQETKNVLGKAILLDNLEFDSYTVLVKVYLDNEEISSDTVTINIKSNTIPFFDDENGLSITTIIIIVIVLALVVGGVAYFRSKKKIKIGKKVIK
ncbi:hypothetical protein J2127_000549 [Methanococcus voltae]|uniref:hypothetical protein n=1 Tax=Methanococcus voltae TaxID=2188 RepID=UPI001AE8756A|nr:hypothetical protein [Methanococcus voltae]MBP2143394.1 hypothetical protein [Methanococcus voltae]